MKVELKNVKHYAGLSQETEAYTATVYVNGVAICTVENDGHGGCDRQFPVGKKTRQDIRAVDEWLQANRPAQKVGDSEFPHTLEMECGDLLSEWLLKKEFARLMKLVCFVRDGAIRSVKGMKAKDFASKKEVLERQFPGVVFWNSLTEDEAYQQFQECAKNV